MKFINRKRELDLLAEQYQKPGAHFVVVYGRRRIGKTRLLEESIRGKKEAIYYLAADEKDALQIKELQELLARSLHDDYLAAASFSDWKNFFAYLRQVWPQKRKLVFIIDEVTYIIKNNPSFPSYLQQFWDSFLSTTETCLIVNGSLVGLMLKEVLAGSSPLYGRRTADIFLQELSFPHVAAFLQKPAEETMPFYAILGGIPKYLELASSSFPHFLGSLFDKNSFFYREGLYLMTEEFNDISTYSNVLRAIAEGNTKAVEIANYSGISSKSLSAYLAILENLGFILVAIPITEGKDFRGKTYRIRDFFLEFWFKFIYPHRSLIEMDRGAAVIQERRNDINSFIGRKFEDACQQFLSQSGVFPFTKIGKQWGKIPAAPRDNNQYEIDICAFNEKSKEILFGECKWQEKADVPSILKELQQKAGYVQWHNPERKEYYAIFAKSFKTKTIAEKNVHLFDLSDMERMLVLKK